MRLHRLVITVIAATGATPLLAAPPPPAAAIADPAKQALAARVAASLWPDGTYGRLVDSMAGGKDGLADMVLDMRPADLMVTFAQAMAEEGKPKDGNPMAEGREPAGPPTPTIREMMIARDPHFEERMRITMAVVGDEVRRISKPIEPRFREGLSKSIARRFSSAELEPIAAFLETEAGRAFAAQSMTMFIDKDVMLAMVQSVPAMIREMPAALEKVKKATAHLPEPPKKEPGESEEGEDADSEDEADETSD